MLLIPAIDLRRGRCVRLFQGNARKETVFSQEPLSIARLWHLRGAKIIHVVDLDGALTGKPRNLEIVYDIVKKIKVPVQLGGGLRSRELIEEVLNKGISRVILGTMSLDKEFLQELIDKYKEKIIAGVDAQTGWVAIKGWKESSSKRPITFARSLQKLGVRRILYTNVKRDGTLQGPNIDSIRTVLKAIKIPLIASGGIASLEDVERLKKLEKEGLEGIVVGKALYTGNIDLKEAIKIAEA